MTDRRPTPQSVAMLLEHAMLVLSALSETASLDVQVLLGHVLEQPRAWVLAHPEAVVEAARVQYFLDLLQRLVQGEPLAYILGHWEFYGLPFVVTPDVLIPRPETELLVAAALEWLRIQKAYTLAADVGTGSGCIAVSLAVNNPSVRVLASDISAAALYVAQANVRQHEVQERVLCVQADLLPESAEQIDLVCANLPYIPREALKELPVSRQEPILALDGGGDGLELIYRLVINLPGRMAANGLALVEIEASQGAAATNMARQVFPQAEIAVLRDLAGDERLLRIGVAG